MLEEGMVSELDRGDVMGLVGMDETAYGYHDVSESGGGRVVSFVVGRRRRRGRLESLREMTMLAEMSDVQRMKRKSDCGMEDIEGPFFSWMIRKSNKLRVFGKRTGEYQEK